MSEFILNSGIEEYKNKYQGERIFLIGNGPSLDDTPLHWITSEYSFSINKINKIYSETEWRPSFYYVMQPPTHPEAPHKGKQDYIRQNLELDIPCFLHSDYSQYSGKNIYHINCINLHGCDLFDDSCQGVVEKMSAGALREFWSEEPQNIIYHYHSMYGGMQLIKYMGFEKVYLLGCDLGFKYFNPHMIFNGGMDPHRYERTVYSYLRDAIKDGTLIKSFINGVALKLINNTYINGVLNAFLSNSDSYFSSDYTEQFRIHDGPRVDREITKSHMISKRMYEDDGLNIYNATIGGELEVYGRVDLEKVL